jgi:hypothetical protein
MWPWPGVEMYKVGLLALSALALLAEAAYASDKIALPCSGMIDRSEMHVACMQIDG